MINFTTLFSNPHAQTIAVVDDYTGQLRGHTRGFYQLRTLDYGEIGQDGIETILVRADNNIIQPDDIVLVGYDGTDVNHIQSNGKKVISVRHQSQYILEVEIK